MSINQTLEKIKPFLNLLLVLLLCLIFFILGRISAVESQKEPVKVLYANSQSTGLVLRANVEQDKEQVDKLSMAGEVIGSKTGKKYYFPWCGTVKRIKPENQVHFASIDLAKQSGYTAGGNCSGLY